MRLTKTTDDISSVTSLLGTVALGGQAVSFTLLTLVHTAQRSKRRTFCLVGVTLLNLRAWTDSMMLQFRFRLMLCLGLLW